MRTILLHLGEDPNRDGLLDTPKRVVAAYAEMTGGYGEDPACILSRRFQSTYDQMVVLRGIGFVSLCEHHMLPFIGVATVGYLPREGTVVGISKLVRLVQCYARRLQIQERMTEQIAGAIQTHLDPLGVGVIVAATHACMSCRGVKQQEASMITSVMLGSFRTDSAARAELMHFDRGRHD